MTAMHFHHKHDVEGCTDAHDEWTDADRTILATLDRLGYILMTAESDALAALGEQLATIAADVASLKDSLPGEVAVAEPLDFSGVQAQAAAILADVQSLLPPPAAAPVSVDQAPAEPAPVDAPAVDAPVESAPVSVDQAPADPAPADAQPADTTVIPAQSIPSVPLA